MTRLSRSHMRIFFDSKIMRSFPNAMVFRGSKYVTENHKISTKSRQIITDEIPFLRGAGSCAFVFGRRISRKPDTAVYNNVIYGRDVNMSSTSQQQPLPRSQNIYLLTEAVGMGTHV